MTPVVDGYALRKAAVKTSRGAKNIDEQVAYHRFYMLYIPSESKCNDYMAKKVSCSSCVLITLIKF